jgi:small subunit ribosomal protein S16
MPVRIRLARFGRIRDPFYRIRVQDSRRSRDGKFIEQVGTYDPIPNRADNMKEVRLDVERIKYWLSVGAQPSKPVARLLGYCGLMPRYVNKSSVKRAVPKAERE